MADRNLIVGGLIFTLFMGIIMISPIALTGLNSLLNLGVDKLSTLIIILFFGGIGVTIVGIVTPSRDRRR